MYQRILRTCTRSPPLRTQDLSNTVWACATLLYDSAQLAEAISTESVQKLHLFLNQELSNTAWAVAKLQRVDRALRPGVAKLTSGRDICDVNTALRRLVCEGLFSQTVQLYIPKDALTPTTESLRVVSFLELLGLGSLGQEAPTHSVCL